jgi:PAS domain S-box-containing protein
LSANETADRQPDDPRPRADLELRLRESEERFRALVDALKDYAISMLDPSGRVVSWNAGAERIKGFSAEEILGQHFSRFYSAEDILDGKPQRELRTALTEGRYEDEGWRIRKDGSRFLANVVITAVFDASGKLVGFAKVTRDITARHLAEVALKRANMDLEAFSYSVAHDLRAPLRGMSGFAQLLLDTYLDKLDHEGQDWLREIQMNAKKMAALIDALLSLARVTRAGLQVERLDLTAEVCAVAAQLARESPERDVEMVIQRGVWASMDPELARVLVANLIGNAWKFTSRTQAARIEFSSNDENGIPTFVVRDNGAGFDMEFASKLFTPFQRLHSGDEFPGTGIGLATVQRIADRHGGRVWAEGSVGAGATFHFTLAKSRTLERAERGP